MFSLRLIQSPIRKNIVCVFAFKMSRISTPPFSKRPISTSVNLLAGHKSLKEERYRVKDKVPLEYHIIYKAPMEYYLSGLLRTQHNQQIATLKHFAPPIEYKTCNFVTSFSFVAFTGISAYAYLHNYHTMAVPFEMEYGTLTANENDFMMFLGFFLLANVLIRTMVNRYPLRIYRNNEKYLAIFEGYLPFTRKQFAFKKGDVVPVSEGGILPWQEARFKINDKNVLLLDSHFRTPSELNAMMKQMF